MAAERLPTQQPKGSNKLYSLHPPEVECISKGKAHKRYEYGVKVGVVASLRTPFILAAHSLPGKSHDGHTVAWSLAHTQLNTGAPIRTAAVDKGYRGPPAAWPGGAEIVIPDSSGPTQQEFSGQRWRVPSTPKPLWQMGLSPTQRHRLFKAHTHLGRP